MINISVKGFKLSDGTVEKYDYSSLEDIVTDDTLALSGVAADAKKVGDEFLDIKEDLGTLTTATSSDINKALSPKTVANGKVTEWQFKPVGGGGSSKVPENVKTILENMMELFEAVAVYNDDVDVVSIGSETNELIENLEVVTLILTGIDVVFNQTDTIYSNASLDDLKQYLTVTAMYDDGSSKTTTAYTLSGTIATGTQTFTVTLGDFSKTFDAVITKADIDYTKFILYQLSQETTFDGSSSINTGVKPTESSTDYDWTIMASASLDANDWSKVIFGWNKYTVATGYIQLNVRPLTQAGYKKIQAYHNAQQYVFDTNKISLTGNQDIKFAIIHNAGDSSTRVIIYWNGSKMYEISHTVTYIQNTNAILYIGSDSANGAFIGTVHDFIMYNTIVDDDTINTYLEG